MSLLDKNEAALNAYDAKFYDAYKKVNEAGINHCVIEECVNHENIICYLKDNHGWRLNSIYEPSKAAEFYAKRYEKIREYAVVCIFGLSDGRAVRRILANCNETQEVVIYEPSVDIFMASMEMFLLEDILQWEKLHLVVGAINEERLQNELEDVVNYQNRELLMQCILPNYDLLFPEEGKGYIEKMIYYANMEQFKEDTSKMYGEIYGNNIMHNLPYILQESSVWNLCKHMSCAEISEIPAIIVSAGPSLDKNIKDLKQAEGKAFIVGVDSALKALVREGIHVNLAVTVDPNKNPDVFADDRINDIPCLVSASALPQVVANNRNRLFFENVAGFETHSAIIEELTGKSLNEVESGGSVATVAFSMLYAMGFKKIILIGQDLAFTGGKGHVSGFERSEEADRQHVAQRGTVMVEALGGGTILTDVQMESYLRWFEMKIEKAGKLGDVVVYNATEGGARIRGTEECTLKEAIEELCSASVDFDKIVADTLDTFTDEERKRLKEEFLAWDERLQSLSAELKRGIRAYEDLIKLERKPNSGQYKKAVQAVARVNHIEETECYMWLVQLYAKQMECDVAEDIYVAEDLSIRDIAYRGISLLESYIKGIAACKKSIEEIQIPGLMKMED